MICTSIYIIVIIVGTGKTNSRHEENDSTSVSTEIQNNRRYGSFYTKKRNQTIFKWMFITVFILSSNWSGDEFKSGAERQRFQGKNENIANGNCNA